MNWDSFGIDEPAKPKDEGELCPEGTHVGTIGWAKVQPKEWAKNAQSNPQGWCLCIRIDVKPGIKAVWETIPCQRRGSIEALCRSARVDPPSGDWGEQALVGKTVTFDSVIALSKQGNDYVKVERFKPGPERPPAEKPAARRTQTQKADATVADKDDIPF